MMTMAGLLLTGVALVAGLAGCASLQGFPEQSISTEDRLQQLAIYKSNQKITEYEAARNPEERRRLRNELINGRLALIDLQFNTFLQDFHQAGVGGNIGADAITIGLGAAGAVVSGGTSQILSATSAGVVGLRQSVDKNALFDQTMPALMAQMMAQRKGVLVRIRDGLLNKSDAQYPLAQGLADLEEYYYAGTIPGAITGVVKSAGAESQRNDRLLETVVFRLDDPAETIKRAIFPDPTKQELDAKNVEHMKRCWAEAGVPPNTFIEDFILQPLFAQARKQVAACMGL